MLLVQLKEELKVHEQKKVNPVNYFNEPVELHCVVTITYTPSLYTKNKKKRKEIYTSGKFSLYIMAHEGCKVLNKTLNKRSLRDG